MTELKPALPNLQTVIEHAVGEEKNWLLAFNKATTMVLNDRPSKPVDAAFFFGRSWFDAERKGIYQLLVDMYQVGLVRNIAIYGNEGQRFGEKDPAMLEPSTVFPQGWRKKMIAPAREIARARLIRMGVPEEHAILTQIPDPVKIILRGKVWVFL